MIVTFLAPNLPQPAGGVLGIYEFANGLSRRDHEVHLVHVPFGEVAGVTTIGEVTWFAFEPAIRHHIVRAYDESDIPRSDVVVCFDDRIPASRGRPLILFQAYRTLPAELEQRILGVPYPKLCISRWLMTVAADMGVPDDQLVHVPYGLNHAKYRVSTPIGARPPQIAMAYNSHPVKGSARGLQALAEVMRRVGDARVAVAGAAPPGHAIPTGMTYTLDPPQNVLVDEFYNRSRIFLCPSLHEGFGLASVEAMACGCALVTTDNGGSREFAIAEETAIVCERGDAEMLAGAVEALIRDDERRIALAERGRGYVERFDWDASAERLEHFLDDYATHTGVRR